MSIINRIELHKNISLCEWCKSTINLEINDLQIYKRKIVIFMCPVCKEYSKTSCVSLRKIKWYKSLKKYKVSPTKSRFRSASPIVSGKVSSEAGEESKKKHHSKKENDWFTLPI